MNDTLRFIAPLVDPELNKLTLEELAYKYQESPTSAVLATSYKKIFKLATLIKNKYWGLNDADVASFCLEKLDFSLRTYTGDAKFTTYFVRVFGNKLREETESLNLKKRKCILESINDLINVGVEDTYNLIDLMLPTNLTENEYKLCKSESEGYDRAYVAVELGVSRMTVHNLEKSLRSKLSYLQFQ